MKDKELPKEYKLHHIALGRGYISRKIEDPKGEEYSGKFGKGYIFRYPAYHTTKYHFIKYYIRGDEDAN